MKQAIQPPSSVVLVVRLHDENVADFPAPPAPNLEPPMRRTHAPEAKTERRLPRERLKGLWAAVVTGAALLFSASAQAKINFVFDYSENPPGVGFLDPVDGPARRAAVNTAAALYSDLFASHFSNSATLNIRILSSVDPADPLAYADSEVVRTPGTFGAGEVIRIKVVKGIDLNGTRFDGTIFFNFKPGTPWELDPNVPLAPGKISFYNAMLHEFTHAIGFASLTLGGSQDIFGEGSPGSNSPGTWNKWDQFLYDNSSVIPVVNPVTFEINQTALNSTEPFGGFFIGPRAVKANGGPVHLSTQRSHLDDNLFPRALMKSGGVDVGIPGFPNVRVWNTVEVGILTDLGYTPVAQPQGYWKNNSSLWPVASLQIGSQSYSQVELLALLGRPVGGDASLILAKQLIAAKLNIANGAAPASISATIAHADGLLSALPGRLPFDVKPSSSVGKAMTKDATALEAYNK